MSLHFIWGSVIPFTVWSPWEEKSRGSPSLAQGDVSCPTLFISHRSLPNQGKGTWQIGISSRSSKLSQMMKTKKSGKGSFIPESQMVLLLHSFLFPKASSPGFPSISLKFRFLLVELNNWFQLFITKDPWLMVSLTVTVSSLRSMSESSTPFQPQRATLKINIC